MCLFSGSYNDFLKKNFNVKELIFFQNTVIIFFELEIFEHRTL